MQHSYHRKHYSEDSGQATPTRPSRFKSKSTRSAPSTPQRDHFRVIKRTNDSPLIGNLRRQLNVVATRFGSGKWSGADHSRASSIQGRREKASSGPEEHQRLPSRGSSVQLSFSAGDDSGDGIFDAHAYVVMRHPEDHDEPRILNINRARQKQGSSSSGASRYCTPKEERHSPKQENFGTSVQVRIEQV